MARICTATGAAPATLPDPKDVAEAVSTYMPAQVVIELLIDKLLVLGQTAGQICELLTHALEVHNSQQTPVPTTGCCRYRKDTAPSGEVVCSNLTEEQCDNIGGEFTAGGTCQDE